MPLTLVATVGDPDANAYITVADAEEYASYRVGAVAWEALTSNQKIQTLVTAATEIDTLEGDPGFLYDRASTTQALAFPRTDSPLSLPAILVKANAELAFKYATAFATGADPLGSISGNGNIKREKVGPIETEYFAAGSTAATTFERFPAVVQRLLYSLVNIPLPSGWGSALVERGT